MAFNVDGDVNGKFQGGPESQRKWEDVPDADLTFLMETGYNDWDEPDCLREKDSRFGQFAEKNM